MLASLLLGFLPHVLLPAATGGDARLDLKRIEAFAHRWWEARPRNAFYDWDEKQRGALLREAEAIGAIPEGSLDKVKDTLWAVARQTMPLPRKRGKMETPYGEATWLEKNRGSPRTGLIIGLHGGGEGAGSAAEATQWTARECLGLYPQGIHLVHDTWNTVHGERFALALIEMAKLRDDVDPDRVYAMGFSMGGSGSWFLAGRHPDLLAGSAPFSGVIMAAPRAQLMRKEEVQSLQHGLLPNVRNLAMYYDIGLADDHCMPGTYLYAWDVLQRLRAEDPQGYAEIQFKTIDGLGHAFPPGEPEGAIKWLCQRRRHAFPEKLVWEYTRPIRSRNPRRASRSRACKKRSFYFDLACRKPIDNMRVIAAV
ncbi:MAG: hypothetical protein U1E76_16880 [Planctomycetota bacterium]